MVNIFGSSSATVELMFAIEMLALIPQELQEYGLIKYILSHILQNVFW